MVGFYYANPENRPVPPRTALMWPQGTWQQYEVDLKDTDEPNVPYRLRELTVMGQGHSYDARIAASSSSATSGTETRPTLAH